jgi:predicted nucleotidyltransferase
MRLAHYPVDELTRELLRIIDTYLDLSAYKVFFFGSRVTGRGTERSDIDLGIEGPEPIPHETLQDIEEKIEALPTLYKIEVVDFRRVPKKFAAVARQALEYLTP